MKKQTLAEFITELSTIKKRMIAGVEMSAKIEAVHIMGLLKNRSPLDKGLFRKNWEIIVQGRVQTNKINFRLQNRTFYGPWLDEGGEIGGPPWKFPSETNPGPISKSGKLKVGMGRIWAGGRSPEGFVEGGIVNQVIYYNVQTQVQMADKLADAVMGAL
jgi:hypothetical protein